MNKCTREYNKVRRLFVDKIITSAEENMPSIHTFVNANGNHYNADMTDKYGESTAKGYYIGTVSKCQIPDSWSIENGTPEYGVINSVNLVSEDVSFTFEGKNFQYKLSDIGLDALWDMMSSFNGEGLIT